MFLKLFNFMKNRINLFVNFFNDKKSCVRKHYLENSLSTQIANNRTHAHTNDLLRVKYLHRHNNKHSRILKATDRQTFVFSGRINPNSFLSVFMIALIQLACLCRSDLLQYV